MIVAGKRYVICSVLVVMVVILYLLTMVPLLTKKRYWTSEKLYENSAVTPTDVTAEFNKVYFRHKPSPIDLRVPNCLMNLPDEVLFPHIKFILYVVYHDDGSEAIARKWCECRPWAVPVKIPTTPFFESIIYRDLFPFLVHEWENLDFMAMATYRSIHIMGGVEGLRQHLLFAYSGKFDVVPLIYTRELLIPQAIGGHSKNIVQVWDNVLTSMGYPIELIRQADLTESYFRNSFIIKPKHMKELITFMNRAIEISLLNSTVSRLLERDSEYKAPTKVLEMRCQQLSLLRLLTLLENSILILLGCCNESVWNALLPVASIYIRKASRLSTLHQQTENRFSESPCECVLKRSGQQGLPDWHHMVHSLDPHAVYLSAINI